jgi:metallo-beta-lactamase family protein
MVDCGLEQGSKYADETNHEPFAYDPASIDVLFVTHAHLDHVGRIAKLVKDGFRGQIYSTSPTKEIGELVMLDSMKIVNKSAEEAGREPLYLQADVDNALARWDTKDYHQPMIFDCEGEPLSVTFRDAGHILGSSMVVFSYLGKKIAFTGDLGNTPSSLLTDTETMHDIDYLAIESVYGDRNHDPHEVRDANFKRAIEEGIKRGGAILIPAFSIERTQVILYELNNLIEDGHIPSIPVYIDSPLAAQVTDIYKRNEDLFKLEVQREIKAGDDIFNFPKLKITHSVQDAKEIHKVNGPKIILAGSGMSEGGRVLGHEAELLPHPENTIILVGFQAMGTVGRRIEEGSKVININHQNIKVRAHVENIRGFSSHKDSDHLLEFVDKSVYGEKGIEGTESDANVKKPKVFVIMGEPKSSLFLAQRIREYLDIEAVYPEALKEYEI